MNVLTILAALSILTACHPVQKGGEEPDPIVEPVDTTVVNPIDTTAVDPVDTTTVVDPVVKPKPGKVSFKYIQNNEYKVKGEKSESNIDFWFPYGTNTAELSFTLFSDYNLKLEPDICLGTVDFSKEILLRMISEDGLTYQEFTLIPHVFAKDTGVRGVYLPSPSHTGSFSTYSTLCSSLDLMQELNFNCLFVGSWSATQTSWPSQTLLKNSTYTDAQQCNMYASYSGGSGDAVQDMITEAHKRGIKVIMWFEYGFMHRVGGVDTSDPVLAKHPEWIGRGSNGGYSNYNGTDYYLNGYDPEVQQFMIDMITEACVRYPELDGIQGDDRLPAMPRNSGYNDNTKAAYKMATGKDAPTDFQNSDWVRWRLDVLNSFAVKLHDAVKAVRPGLLVCFAPNKYPWCKSALMQDWPAWMKAGAVDLMTVQCYVTANYERDVESQLQYCSKNGKCILNPAMILKNGNAVLPEDLLIEELTFNRKCGTCGESQFWFDGLRKGYVKETFRKYYSYPVAFPEL